MVDATLKFRRKRSRTCDVAPIDGEIEAMNYKK
jgi:hypothetical protein